MRIVTDSAADLPHSLAVELGITTVPIRVNIGGTSFQDGIDFPSLIFSNKTEAGQIPSTSQPSPWDFRKVFQDMVAQGEEVLCLTLSRKLSGTFRSATIAAGQVKGKIQVVDSNIVSAGQGLLIYKLAQLASEAHVDELALMANSLRENIHSYAALDSVEPIVTGGRTSLFARHAAGREGVKLIFTINLKGEIQILERVRGRRQSLDRLIELAAEKDSSQVTIAHVNASGEAASVARGIQEKCRTDVLYIQEAGGAVRTYAGPGAIIVAG